MEFVGRLTADAQVKTFGTEKSVTKFRVAIDQGFMHKGQWVDKTLFMDCEYWRGAGVAPYLQKGVLVQVAGWLELYVNEDTGKARLVCHLDKLKLHGRTGGKNKGQQPSVVQEPPAVEAVSDDLPF